MEMTRKRASNSFRRKLRPALAFQRIPPRANNVKHQWVSWTAEKREPRPIPRATASEAAAGANIPY